MRAPTLQVDKVWPKPGLLMTCIFSAYFFLLANTTGNCLMFAKYVVLAFRPDSPVDADLQKTGAVVIQTLVCMALYRSVTTGRLLNRFFSVYKILLLIVIIIAGFCAVASNRATGLHDFKKDVEYISPTSGKASKPKTADYATALLLVLYSFHGWENANYVCVAHSSVMKSRSLDAYSPKHILVLIFFGFRYQASLGRGGRVYHLVLYTLLMLLELAIS